jgi:photosynthetic reaction center cytochrome c subunit
LKSIIRSPLLALAVSSSLLVAGCNESQTQSKQIGYRGLGMEQVDNPKALEALAEENIPPAPIDPAGSGGDPASKVYKNVQVLGDLNDDEFIRLMTAITQWVAPEQGCSYCHNTENLASDEIYAKVVARRMLQMTQHINAEWKTHVGSTGVTCYTCHHGQPVPANIWFTSAETPDGTLGNRAGKNAPAPSVGLASLPNDPFTSLLDYSKDIRVVGKTALPESDQQGAAVKQTEVTYGLMMSMSKALGVNCTYCHNTRSFTSWDQSTPQRATAWYGIRMVRDLNTHYLEPLKASFPASHLGLIGDVPKINCATCHQGVPKPLNGANMVKDYPELSEVQKK